MKKTNLTTRVGISVYVMCTCVLVLTPLVICLVNSFRSTGDMLRGFLAFPEKITLENYATIIVQNGAVRYLFNSLMITVLAVFFNLLTSPFVAFVIATRWNDRKYRLLYVFLSACMLIPENILLFPLIKLLYSLGLMNRVGLLFYYAVFFIPGNVFILVPYFRMLDKEILEAACLDGCTEIQLFYRIFLPVCKPIVLTVLILNTIWVWNDFLLPLLILNKSPETWTIPIFIYNYVGRSSFMKNLAFSSCQLALIPIFLFYGTFHKQILSGLRVRHGH